jgi:tetratricopeptide (TPR) repeat protein
VAYQNLKRTPDAMTAFREAVQGSDGKFAPAQFALASLLSEQQSFAEAETVVRKGLESDGKSATGHYELARALLGQGKAPEAETEAKASLELSPKLPQNYLILAAVCANRGQAAEAIEELDAYLRLVPTGPMADSVHTLRENLSKQVPQAKAGGAAEPQKPR